MNRVCKKCNLEKNLDEMVKSKKTKSGYGSFCKDCNRLKSKKYREDNKDYHDKYSKDYYNRPDIKERSRLNSIKYRQDNKDKLKIQKDKWKENNKEKIKEYNKEYNINRKKTDPIYRLNRLISSIIRKSFYHNGFKKSSRTYEIIGISFDEFKLYIESKFEDWMTWENRGLYNGELNYGWDIDHIIPLSTAETEEDIIKLNHYTNLQPLCSKVNRDIKKDNLNYNNSHQKKFSVNYLRLRYGFEPTCLPLLDNL